MAINDFKPFAVGPGANVTPQADWEALPALLSGFMSGKASSAQINKAIRQAAFIAAALAQYTANKSGEDVLDDGDVAGFIAKMSSAFGKDYQPLDATLTALAGLVGAANKLAFFNGADTAALTDLTQVGRDIIGKTSIADVLQYLDMNTPRIATITSSKTITLPPWVTTIYVTACGGGGGGGAGGGGNSTYYGGGGGGGGAGQSVYKKSYTITAGSSIAVTIGAGGGGANGTISAGATGTAGGSTIVGSLVSLSGGSPGVGGLNATSGNTVGGSSGGGGYPKGSDGGDGSLTYGGGNGGVGASSPLGGGGSTGRAGTTSGAPGGSAGGYGCGGGGGGGKYSAVAGTGLGGDGGNGTPGIVIIEW